jgi:hypothetical protein
MVARRRNGYWKQLKFPGKSPPTGAVALANIYTPWPRRKDKGINTLTSFPFSNFLMENLHSTEVLLLKQAR